MRSSEVTGKAFSPLLTALSKRARKHHCRYLRGSESCANASLNIDQEAAEFNNITLADCPEPPIDCRVCRNDVHVGVVRLDFPPGDRERNRMSIIKSLIVAYLELVQHGTV